MKIYFDTSALVKFFHEEEGTIEVTELITDPENDIIISELSKIEFYSAIHRRYRRKEINNTELGLAIVSFEKECTNFKVVPVSSIIMQEAMMFIQKYGKNHGLRTLDAIHLATFFLLKDNDWLFVASDDNLNQIVSELKTNTFNPMKKA